MYQALRQIGHIIMLLILLLIPTLGCSLTITTDRQETVPRVVPVTQVVIITQIVTQVVTPTPTPVDEGLIGFPWRQWSLPVSPSPRMEMGFVYDAKRNLIVAVGGTDWASAFNETWEYNGESWILRKDVEKSPGRIRPAMAYDSDRQVIVLFGGSDLGDNTFFNDIWEYDGVSWVQQHPQNPPSPRNGAVMAYDPIRQSMLLFGGYERWGPTRFFDETWEYVDAQWVQRFPAHHPDAREASNMVYDAARGKMVLFGGGRDAGSTVYDDTWEWDGKDWTQRLDLPSSPPARWAHGMAYDSDRNCTILFGGLTGVTDSYNDTWEYDGKAWSRVATTAQPSGRWDAGMVYDTLTHRVVLFGGQVWHNQFSWLNDTWTYKAS